MLGFITQSWIEHLVDPSCSTVALWDSEALNDSHLESCLGPSCSPSSLHVFKAPVRDADPESAHVFPPCTLLQLFLCMSPCNQPPADRGSECFYCPFTTDLIHVLSLLPADKGVRRGQPQQVGVGVERRHRQSRLPHAGPDGPLQRPGELGGPGGPSHPGPR